MRTITRRRHKSFGTLHLFDIKIRLPYRHNGSSWHGEIKSPQLCSCCRRSFFSNMDAAIQHLNLKRSRRHNESSWHEVKVSVYRVVLIVIASRLHQSRSYRRSFLFRILYYYPCLFPAKTKLKPCKQSRHNGSSCSEEEVNIYYKHYHIYV